MKKLFLISIIIIFTLNSCQQKENLKKEVFITGSALSDQIIETYLQVQKITFKSQYLKNFAEILISDQDTVFFAPKIKTSEHIYLYITYKELLNIYIQKFDPEFKVSDDQLKRKSLTLITQIDSLFPQYSEQTQEIKNYINAFNFKPLLTLKDITHLLVNIFEKDVKNWRRTLDSSYNDFAYKIDKIPPEVFDYEKLNKIIVEPYKDKNKLAEIYKLNLKKEAYKFKSDFNDKAAKYYIAFKNYEIILSEFLKRNPDYNFVYFELERIKNIIGIKNVYEQK